MEHHLLTDEAQGPFVRIDRKANVKMRDGEKQNGYIRAAYLVSIYVKVTDNCNARKNHIEKK